MAESSWPSPDDGRVVDDVEFEKWNLALGPQGAVIDYITQTVVFADSTGMQVKISADKYAHVRGHTWWSGSSTFTKAIASNASGSTRVDMVVLRLSRTTWNVTVEVVQGTPGAGAPSATQTINTTGTWEMPLALVTVANGAATITAGNVTYVAAHMVTDGKLVVANTTALTYVPGRYTGMEVYQLDTGATMVWNGSAWVDKFGWKDWSAVVYHNMSTTRTTYGSFSVNRARYNKIGRMVWASADITVTNATTGGLSASLPVAAVSMQNSIVGSGAVINSAGAPTQDGFVIIGAGLDNVQPVTFTTGFVNSTAGTNRYRFTICYESAS